MAQWRTLQQQHEVQLAAYNTAAVAYQGYQKALQDYNSHLRAAQAVKAHNRQCYTGKPHDDATGLSYFGARLYDPVDWNEANPIHSFNRYAYANNNPFKFVDPDGRE